MLTFVAISKSPRRDLWMRLLGTDYVPVRGLLAEPTVMPDGSIRDVYMVAVEQLTSAQLAAVVGHFASELELDAAYVEREIRGAHGLPILAEDVSIFCDTPWFL